MRPGKRSAFVAYTRRDSTLGDMIFAGVAKANSIDAAPIRYEPWEYNDISGTQLISPIIEHIDSSPYVVADITYLNQNVVYEVGFTIGRRKKVLLIRHASIPGDRTLASTVGIFDTIGYSTYSTDIDVRNKLTSHISDDPIPFQISTNHTAPVYIVPSSGRAQASQSLIARIKKARYRYRSFSATEDIRLSAADAIHQVAQSAGVIVFLDDQDDEQMIRSLFVAGLADGMGKPLLVLAPHTSISPLDVRDQVKTYRDPSDIAEIVANFCPEINAKLQETSQRPALAPNFLARVSIGDPTAENEMTTLANYYLQTDQYLRALRGEVNLVVGRKGSGKTALFIRLRDTVRADKRNIVVDLKPESYQLLKLKDELLTHLAEGSRQHLITAFWEYLILLEVTYKLLEKDRSTYKFNHEISGLYDDLDAIYRGSKGMVEGDFSERILQLSSNLSANYLRNFGDSRTARITSEALTEILYSHDLRGLKEKVSQYLAHKQRVLVLFDNLDKSWSTSGVDDIDSITLRCLIEAGRKIERDMQRRGHKFRCIIFVRNDVYQHLMANSPDYGKEMRATLDWNDPDLLREVIRLRLVADLDPKEQGMSFEAIWSSISISHVFGEESSSFIIDRSLMRPRNALKLLNHVRAFAINLGKEKIDQDDYYRGVRAYSQDLLVEIDRELSDVFPEAKDLLYYFMDSDSILGKGELYSIITEAGVPAGKADAIRDFLFFHGVIGLRLEDRDLYIFDVGYDLKQILIRSERLGDSAKFVLNSAFAPALEIKDGPGAS